MDLRQIDVLVHQHVMEVDLTGFDWPTGFRDRMVRETRDGDGVRVEWIDIPRYSSEITAAWRVVEKMRRSGWDYFSLVQGHKGAWDCMFMQWSGPDDDEVSQEIADTAPLAICLAALRAVGVEVPQDA